VIEARFCRWRSPYGKAGLNVSVILLGLRTFFVPVSSIRATNQGNVIESVQVVEQAHRTAEVEKICPQPLAGPQ